MPETQFTETKALLLALRDDSDEGDVALENYLLNNFLPGELRGLIGACERLKWAARDAVRVLDADRSRT